MCCVIPQGTLALLEEQIKGLQEQLDSRDATVAELIDKISDLEASNLTSNQKIGMLRRWTIIYNVIHNNYVLYNHKIILLQLSLTDDVIFCA